MVSVFSLWLAILLSAVAVFIVSSIIHMMLKYHQSDFSQVPNEDAVMDSLRPFNIPPGDYYTPYAGSMEAMKDPAYQDKLNQGPKIVMTVMPNGPGNMGKSLGLWFVYSIVVGIFVAWVGARTLPAGAEYGEVFCVAALVAFAGYGLALLQGSIWWGKKWSATLKSVIDALIYALVTAGIFGWLWP